MERAHALRKLSLPVQGTHLPLPCVALRSSSKEAIYLGGFACETDTGFYLRTFRLLNMTHGILDMGMSSHQAPPRPHVLNVYMLNFVG